jgi:hypothetical protein
MLALQKELGATGEISIETVLRAPGVLRMPEEQIAPEEACRTLSQRSRPRCVKW